MSQVRPILDVRELRVEYMSPSGPVVAADNVSFHIDPGEVYGLAGESGCGKSTVALALLRVLGPPAVMYGGQMVEGAESEELVKHPAHPYTQRLLDAVPDPLAEHGERSGHQRWEPPILVDPPPGCPFAPRCPYVMPVCREVMPGPTHLNDRHWVRCHLHGSGDTAVPMAAD